MKEVLAPSPGSTAPGSTAPRSAATGSAATGSGAPKPAAERVADRRLLNAYLRETGVGDPRVEGDRFRIDLPATGRALTGELTYWSVTGHHDYCDELWLCEGGTATPCGHRELVAALLAELDSTDEASPRRQRLAEQIDNSVRRTTRYLEHVPEPCPSAPRDLTRYAEHSLLTGHPFHPTPKSAEGFSDDDLTAYAPELGASFVLHHLAVAPDLLVEQRVAPGEWTPDDVPGHDGFAVLPVHPWQASYLSRQPAVQELIEAGSLVPLGPGGRTVYPTSSVRTVCDPGFETAWKLPLHVRITNFVRNNPVEHLRRAADASRLVAELRRNWIHEGFEVLLETGFRTIDHPELAADIAVLYRENPFHTGQAAPQVVAGLLEDRPGAGPGLVGHVRTAVGRLTAAGVAEWLRRYLSVSLLPVLALWRQDGLSLEAHVQNSLVHLENGWPTRFYVRDMEGTVASRERLCRNGMVDLVGAASPALYDDAEAWMRFKYYVVTNHLGHLVHVLGRHGEADESALWGVVAAVLRDALPDRYVCDLLAAPDLPAKANLISRFAERGETPVYLTIPNPMREETP
ncbi:IucA/IucC family protein [Saccharopolyspora taberi]|uniref:L-2,3-diaminopropanoate--citrate ligase SbnE n=1 Tax=Saccharopolyspora taberi TaxID=60895 RepID=A0ABN3V3C9_9PSEU